jgi:hypothetical protein
VAFIGEIVMSDQFEDQDIDQQEEIEEEISDGGYIDDPNEYVAKTGKPIETFRSKEQFDEFGQLRSELKSLREDVTKWRTTAQTMGSMYTDLDKNAYDRAYSDLQEKMFEASQMGNTEAYQQHSQQLQNLSWQDQQRRQQAQQAQMQKIEEGFAAKNHDWYNDQNPELKNKAQLLLKKYLVSSPNTNLMELLQLVEDEIREFHIPKKPQASSPPNISRGSSNTNKSVHEASNVKIPAAYRKAFEKAKADMARMSVTNYSEKDFIASKQRYGEL